ncbi:MAG: hypothetical protein HOV77_14560 [Hamadaea sp.]|uniref:hypothetical protein n=1 Tax=Hamadaea sp. TaxID=2024425 RepID=UPI001846F863|nr:hypothetical protein [Hamadaea sp.]NUT20405.1 hypothetical protein [Hamadaea sp.]
MGDGDLLQAELEGLRAFSGDARKAALGFTGVAGETLPDIEAAAYDIGNPPGFLEIGRFSRVALADLKVLRSFSLDFGDGLSSTGYAADLAAGWYSKVEQRGKKTLQKIEDALVAGTAPGPDYGDEVTVPAAPPAAPKDYGYARPDDVRTGWDNLSLEQIKALVLGVDVTAVTDLAAGWRRVADAIAAAQQRFGSDVKSIHWYGEGGTEFHRNVDKTIASAKRWRASADERAAAYEQTAIRIANAQTAIRNVSNTLKSTTDGLKLDYAQADTPKKQQNVLDQIDDAKTEAADSARDIAKTLGNALALTGDVWDPADRYRGLLGLDPAPPTAGLDTPGDGPTATPPKVPGPNGGPPDVPGPTPPSPGPPTPGPPGPSGPDKPGDDSAPTGSGPSVSPPSLPGTQKEGVGGAAVSATPPLIPGFGVPGVGAGGAPVLSGRPPIAVLPPSIGDGAPGTGGGLPISWRGGLSPSINGRGTARPSGARPPVTRLPGASVEALDPFDRNSAQPPPVHRLDDGALPMMPGLAGRTGLGGLPGAGGGVTSLQPGSIVDRSGLVTGRAARPHVTTHGDEDLPPGMALGRRPSPGVRLDGRWSASSRAFAGPIVEAVETQPRPDVLRTRTVSRGGPRWTEPVPTMPTEPSGTPGSAPRSASAGGSADQRRRARRAGERHG